MDTEDSKELAVLRNEVREHILPRLTEVERDLEVVTTDFGEFRLLVLTQEQFDKFKDEDYKVFQNSVYSEIRKHGLWWKLLTWTLSLFGASQTDFGQHLMDLFRPKD